MANTVRCIRGSPPGTTEPAPRPGRAPAIGHTLVPAGALGFCDAPHRTFCGARLPRSAGVAAKVLLTGFSAHVGEAAALRSGDLFEACSGGRADTHGRRRSPPRILRCPAARVTATAITFGDATGLRRWVFVRHRPQATGHRARAKGQGGIDVPVPSAGGDGNGGPAEAHRHRQDRACLDRDHPGAYQEHSESLCILDPSPPEGNQVTGMRRRRSPVGLGRRTVSTPSSRLAATSCSSTVPGRSTS